MCPGLLWRGFLYEKFISSHYCARSDVIGRRRLQPCRGSVGADAASPSRFGWGGRKATRSPVRLDKGLLQMGRPTCKKRIRLGTWPMEAPASCRCGMGIAQVAS